MPIDLKKWPIDSNPILTDLWLAGDSLTEEGEWGPTLEVSGTQAKKLIAQLNFHRKAIRLQDGEGAEWCGNGLSIKLNKEGNPQFYRASKVESIQLTLKNGTTVELSELMESLVGESDEQ